MAGKETPRQKLVKLMYLVFLALMALNIDVSVLNSFVLVDDALTETNINFNAKVEMVYRDFDQQRAISEDLVYPYYGRAQEVRALSENLANMIDSLRSMTMAVADGIDFERADTMSLMELRNKDNYSRTTRYWMVENMDGGMDVESGSEGSRAYWLRQTIEEYREAVLNLLDSNHREQIRIGLDTEGPFFTEGGDEITWQRAMFDRIPPVASATNLSRFIGEVRNVEFDIISTLYSAITEDDFTFDQIEARVVPRSQIVMAGDSYEAEVFVAAYDTRQQPTVRVNGREVPVEDGIGRLNIPARREGAQNFSGVIEVITPAGIIQEYPFEGEYMVQAPSVTVSADAMNVFYAGIDNPVSVSVPGLTDENINASISGGSITRRGGGNYIVRVPGTVDNVTVSVNARIGGTTRSMGTRQFRVRTIPDPTPRVAGIESGDIDRDRIRVSPVVSAAMPEDFDFDMDFEIASFSMYAVVGGDYWERSSSTNRLTDEMLNQIQRMGRGSRITFTDIRTKPAADGLERELAPVSLRIR